jgi:hypothetical protein
VPGSESINSGSRLENIGALIYYCFLGWRVSIQNFKILFN